MKNKKGFDFLLVLSVIITILFFVAPILSLVVKSKADFIHQLGNPIVIKAVLTSLKSSAIALAIVVILGIPFSYVLAKKNFRFKSIVELIVELPMVLPPSVAGLLLLITFGRNGFIGKWLYDFGIQIPFSFQAIIIAQVFVAMPLFIRTVRAGMEDIDEGLEKTAELLGDSKAQVFFKITIPLCKNNISAGAILSWARALGEFGATIMFAGNVIGKTQTLPLAIYMAMENNMDVALAIAVILLIICISVLIFVKFIGLNERKYI